MSDRKDFLVEIGTEELPPKALKKLSEAFTEGVLAGLKAAELTYGEVRSYATPRRLAILISDLIEAQPDREIVKRGPALTAAFDGEGNPSKAASGFARSCGVEVSDLEKLETDKGSWLIYQIRESGKATTELLAAIIESSLMKLPVPKRMRWGDSEVEFVRPVHWLMMLFGSQVLDAKVLGLRAGGETRGHRFHAPQAIPLNKPADYESTLETEGRVIADFARRQAMISEQVKTEADKLGGRAEIDPALLDEVSALVEWPVVISGRFDESFLEIPAEVLISSMKDHQKYFHVRSQDGQLLPNFITISNIVSSHPEYIQAGNERVIRPRLSDAAFFWKQDLAKPLSSRLAQLEDVVFQHKLGSLADKSRRIASLSRELATSIGADPQQAEEAALLSKCDLMSAMVGEFPELQGTMGRHYARREGKPAELAASLEEVYMPRFAGDALPAGHLGQCLAIADKLDTLTGIFGIGQLPSGDRDPFALRRAALGVLRIIIECELPLNLHALLVTSAGLHGAQVNAPETAGLVFDFMMERLRRYYLDAGITSDVFDAVLNRRPEEPLDFDRRIKAVSQFRALPSAESLAAANKRIGNILKKVEQAPQETVNDSLLQQAEETRLAAQLKAISAQVTPQLERGDYAAALLTLSGLRENVDSFFDAVMVMCDDLPVRENRLALLNSLHQLFLQVADISRLQN